MKLQIDYGTTECNGTTYQVTMQPECGNYGTEGGIAWYANGTDDEGFPVRIVWLPTEAYLASDQTDDGDACDWTHAEHVEIA